jgi:hypothetical protein
MIALTTKSQNNISYHTLALVFSIVTLFSISCAEQKKNDDSGVVAPQKVIDSESLNSDNPPESDDPNINLDEGLLYSQPTFGRYVGVLKHLKTENDQVAKIDFIMTHENGSELRLKAVMSLYFGDFSSNEYITYHFDDVKFNVLTGTMVFDQPDQGVTLKSITFKSGKLVAKVISTIAGVVGEVHLEKDGTSAPSRPLVPKVMGEYYGTCDEIETTLMLSTYRTTEDTVRVGNPFGAYKIRGSISDRSTYDCGADGTRCVTDNVLDGSYDFYTGSLNLFGKKLQYKCVVNGFDVDCGRCKFKRVESIDPSKDTLEPILSKNLLVSTVSEPGAKSKLSGISGEYRGYLHHERLNQYQAGAIDIVTYQNPNNGNQVFTMSANARLYFGNHNSEESLTYKFNPRPFNILSPVFVFERMEADVDAILQVVSIKNGVVKGVWYSIQFGRVGTFSFSKNDVSNDPIPSNLIKPLSGIYEANGMELFLDTRIGVTPVNSLNPYFPMTLGGFLKSSPDLAPNIQITGGSYDFYTGKLGIKTARESQVIVGVREQETRSLRLRKPSDDIMRVEQEFEPIQFQSITN